MCEKCNIAACEARTNCYGCYLEAKLSVTETFAHLQGDRVRAFKETLELIASGPPSFAREAARTALARDNA